MIEMDIMKYIVEEALIVIPVLWVLGTLLKRTPKVQDWMIVWALFVVGILLTISLLGFTAQAIMQGVLVSGAAVLGHQLLKQTIEKK
jgi:RsiW-degrading membrane proteinase PrsW (M82 family)